MKRKRLMEKSDTVPVVTPAADTDAANVLPSCSETAPTDHPPGDDGDTAGKCEQSTPIKVKLKRHVCQNIKNKTNPHSKDIKAECPKCKFQSPCRQRLRKKYASKNLLMKLWRMTANVSCIPVFQMYSYWLEFMSGFCQMPRTLNCGMELEIFQRESHVLNCHCLKKWFSHLSESDEIMTPGI